MPMGHKTVLVAGATGLVGYAALKHFTQAPDIDVIAVSRRRHHDYAEPARGFHGLHKRVEAGKARDVIPEA